ncbi:MAG: hypothetical protein IJK23_12370, partial [Clostridia bacterium]|nr:hypothetical protein [Clostridia bacterium]
MQNRHAPAKRLISVLMTICLVFSLIPAVSSSAASDYALVRQASVAGGYYRIDHTLKVNNVDAGTKLDYGYAGLNDVSNPSPVYIKSYQAQIGNYTGSTATLNVDRSKYSNVLNTGMNITLYMANCTACYENCVRWGVQLYAPTNGASLGNLGNGHDSITVTSANGTSLTYTFTNASGSAMNGCETAGGDWTRDVNNVPETAYGPYTWYLSGSAPAIGDSVTVRIVAITVARAQKNNYQMHSEWIDLTIKGVCNHSNGYTSTSTASSHLKSAATCTSPAVFYKSCTTCGANGSETFTSGGTLPHSYTSQTTTSTYLKSAATCLSPAVYYYKCATCSAMGTDTYTSGSALPHSYTGAVRSDGNGATATHSFKCVNGCNNYGNATTHTWNAGSVTTQPTCTGTGVKTYTCTVTGCGATYTQAVNANGHTMQEIPAKAATCLAAGNNKYYKCTTCNKYYTTADGATETTVAAQTIAQKSHSYTGAVRDNANGTHSFKCVNGCNEYGGAAACSYAFDSFVWNAGNTSAQAKLICSVCGNEKSVAAAMSNDPHAATCTAAGYTVYTASYDGHTDTKTVNGDPATGHTYAEPAEGDWTWTKSGDTYTATVEVSCVHNDDTTTLTATVELTEDVAATHLVDGHKTYTATATIGDQTFTATKTDVIEAEGHIWDYASADVTYAWADDFSTCTATVPCSNCDETTTVDASEITHSTTTTANCHRNGIETYVAAFAFEGLGASTTKDLGKDMSNHDGETEVRGKVEANCHTDGYTGDTYCLGCNNKIADGENTGKDMSKHDGETEIRGALTANCHTDGYTGDTYCLGCNNKIADGENTGKDMTKHDGEKEVRGKVEANCHTDGYTGDTYCLGCNNKIADGENTGKDMTKHDGETEVRGVIEANCHTEGYTGDTYCLGCNNKIADGENTGKDMSKHDGETELRNAKEPGYTFKGYTGDKYCAACDHFVSAGEDVDELTVDSNGDVIAAKTVSADAAADPDLYDADDVSRLNAKLAELDEALAIDDNDVQVLAIVAELKALVESMDAIVYYNVTFTVDGVEVKTERVREGESATAPDEEEYINNGGNHKKFSGWTGDYTNVTDNITVTATYDEEAHNWINGEVTKAANCYETGTQAQSCVCGATKEKTLPVDENTHVGGVGTRKENETQGSCTTAPTWDEVEYCLGCGATLTSTPVTGTIDENAHNWGEWTVSTPATCAAAGEETRVCANNPNHKETREIAATGAHV